MNRPHPFVVAISDQVRAGYRDYAQGCAAAYDEFIKAQFTPDQAMILLEQMLETLGARCDAST